MADTYNLVGVLQYGTHAARPAASAVAKGTVYAESDTYKAYQSDGSAWNLWLDGSTGSGTNLNPGTSFPGTPATNTLCFRTDRGLLYFYDGTRWLTVNLYQGILLITTNPVAATGDQGGLSLLAGQYDVYVVSLHAVTYLGGGTSDASNYWTIQLKSKGSNLGTAISTSADTISTYTNHTQSIASVVTAPTYFNLTFTKTGAPGSLYGQANYAISYRLIG